LWTSFTDLETEGAPVLWRRLEGVPFVAKAVLTPDADAAGQITLTGDLRVVIVWGGGTEKLVASAAVDELRLVRVPGTDRWRLPREEVERTAQVAGLDLTEPRLPALIFVAAGVACCVLLGTLVVLIRRGRSHGVVGA
jgi:hypothetical protein